MRPVPVLLLGDAPNGTSGLGRIMRDLASRMASLPEMRVGVMGRGINSSTRHLPFPLYPFDPRENFGERLLQGVWEDFAGNERGILMTIWDATRLSWLALPQTLPPSPLRTFLGRRPFALWGYFPVDGACASGRLDALSRAVIAAYDRVIAYGRYGAKVIGTQEWAPHGIDTSIFKPTSRNKGREMLNARAGGRWQCCEDDILVGTVATNHPRKDWGLTAAILSQLKQRYGKRLKGWWHTDTAFAYDRPYAYNMASLCEEFGIAGDVLVVEQEWSDRDLASAYAACNVTIAPGMEGFGYPLVESMVCGTPVVTGSDHGGSELVPPSSGVLVDPVAMRVEGPHNVMRHVHDPATWAPAAAKVIEDDYDPRVVSEPLGYLNWDGTLFKGVWQKLLLAGVKR